MVSGTGIMKISCIKAVAAAVALSIAAWFSGCSGSNAYDPA